MKKQITAGTAVALCALTAVSTFNVTLLACRSGLNSLLPSYTVQQEVCGKLGEIKQTVDQHFVGTYDVKNALDMAAAGFMVGVGDRWSSYLTAEEYREYQLNFSGQLVGIGVAVSYDEEQNKIRISDVYEGSPADKAGLRRGDQILGAGDKTLAKDGYNAVVAAVGGTAGTRVTLTIRHAADGTTDTVTCERKKINKVTVRGTMLDNKIGYLRIRDFDGGTDTQFKNALQKLLDDGAKKLIFDVRFNPGGSVKVMANMLDELLPKGTIITLKPKDGEDGEVYTSDEQEINLPMTVLVNADSISAAEFFAAALQEYGKAVVVGDKTIGKGYSQRQYPLSDGSALILSDQMYYTPKGKNLAGVGITPDVQISLPEEKYKNFEFIKPADDDQLQAAIQVLNK